VKVSAQWPRSETRLNGVPFFYSNQILFIADVMSNLQ